MSYHVWYFGPNSLSSSLMLVKPRHIIFITPTHTPFNLSEFTMTETLEIIFTAKKKHTSAHSLWQTTNVTQRKPHNTKSNNRRRRCWGQALSLSTTMHSFAITFSNLSAFDPHSLHNSVTPYTGYRNTTTNERRTARALAPQYTRMSLQTSPYSQHRTSSPSTLTVFRGTFMTETLLLHETGFRAGRILSFAQCTNLHYC